MDIARLIAARRAADIVTCTVTDTVRDAARLLAEKRIGAMPVLGDGRIEGIFSERDVLYRLAQDGAACLDCSVGEIMTAPAVTTARGTTVDEALAVMTARRIRHLPVVDGQEMIGFISIGDLVKARIDEVTAEAEQMRQYIQTA